MAKTPYINSKQVCLLASFEIFSKYSLGGGQQILVRSWANGLKVEICGLVPPLCTLNYVMRLKINKRSNLSSMWCLLYVCPFMLAAFKLFTRNAFVASCCLSICVSYIWNVLTCLQIIPIVLVYMFGPLIPKDWVVY